MIPKGKFVVKVYKGKEAIKRLIDDFTRAQKHGDCVYGFGYEDKIDAALGKGWWRDLRVKSKHVKWQAVYSYHAKSRKPSSKRARVRYVKAGSGLMEVAIWKDTVRVFDYNRKNPRVILIHNKEIAKGFKNYWKFLWSQGKESKRVLKK